MRRSTCLRVFFVVAVASCGFLATPRPGHAEEEAWRFLEGLRQRRYYDMALEYLERIENSPRCPEDLKEQIDYERGVTLIDASRVAGAPRQERLNEARDALEAFLAEHPQHPLAGTANTQLANVLVERGRMKAALAERPSKSAEEKKQLIAEAREHYEAARKVFVTAEQRAYERAKALEEEARKDVRKEGARDEARRELLQARLSLALVVYEIGKTHEPSSKPFKENVAKAAEELGELSEKYGDYTAGLYARMREGEARKDLGQADKAITIFREMLTVPGESDTARNLRNESLGLLLETYLRPKVERYDDALEHVAKWQEAARDAEQSSPAGLKIRFLAGKAAMAKAESLEEGDANRKDYLQTARNHFKFVARFPGDYQRDARTLLTEDRLGGGAEAGEPETFVDAKDQAELAWGTMVVAIGRMQDATSAEDQKKTQAEMAQARDEAFRYYRLALDLRTEEVDLAEVNLIRFRLAYLYWLSDDFYRAAVMGEFLATHYPQSLGAPQAAEIALKAYRKLFLLAPDRPEERAFETRRMTEVGKFITTRWTGQPAADDAWMVLLETAIDNRDMDTAQACLAEIDPESPRRAEAELRTGQALWAVYVQQSSRPEEERPPQEKLDQLSADARKTLEQGIARMREKVEQGGAVDYTLVYSVLSLAQIYIGAGQSEEAVKWLDDPKVGPMALVAADHPATTKEAFRIETYKAALRAYVGAQQLDKAEATMDALESAVAAGGDTASAQRITEIYIVLGRELQETLKRLRQEDKDEEADRVSRGFEVFLSRISNREKGNTFNSLNWVAETFYNLGAGMEPEDEQEEAPEKAKDYYKSAAKTYLSILTRIKQSENGEFAPTGAETNIQKRLAACLRALGDHANALKILVKILQKREQRVDVQVEAARTYQDWAKLKGKSGYYLTAIKGGHEQGGRYLVWGWGGIARRVAYHPKFEDVYHEARYHVALCRYRLAMRQSGSKREATLKDARLDVQRDYSLDPTLGGAEWFEKYDDLLKDVQRQLQQRPVGLKALAQAE